MFSHFLPFAYESINRDADLNDRFYCCCFDEFNNNNNNNKIDNNLEHYNRKIV